MRYQRKPNYVQAMQFKQGEKEPFPDFIMKGLENGDLRAFQSPVVLGMRIGIRNDEGFNIVEDNDYIIFENGAFLPPCPEDIFWKYYELANNSIPLVPQNILSTIQKNGKLNDVVSVGQPHEVNKGYHYYQVKRDRVTIANIAFQNGPRDEKGSVPGVLDVDLLEIVRHRLQAFQTGPYATRENAIALTHIEEALLWLNKRVEDRLEAGKLGTNDK